MTRLSHKALKDMGKALGGYYYDGNIYAHENRRHFLTVAPYGLRREGWKKEIERLNPEIMPLVDDIIADDPDSVDYEQIAYSCGQYGNSGQLHRITYYRNGNPIRTIYLYC